MVLDERSLQEFQVNDNGAPQGPITGPKLFLLYIKDIPDDAICNIAIYADGTSLYPRCDLVFNLWQTLKLVSQLESDLGDTVDYSKKWHFNFNSGKKSTCLI